MVDTFWSAREAMREETFADVVRCAIAFGADCDTTACTAAGLAGIKFGLQGIPQRWLKGLRGFDDLFNVVVPFIEHLETHG